MELFYVYYRKNPISKESPFDFFGNSFATEELARMFIERFCSVYFYRRFKEKDFDVRRFEINEEEVKNDTIYQVSVTSNGKNVGYTRLYSKPYTNLEDAQMDEMLTTALSIISKHDHYNETDNFHHLSISAKKPFEYNGILYREYSAELNKIPIIRDEQGVIKASS